MNTLRAHVYREAQWGQPLQETGRLRLVLSVVSLIRRRPKSHFVSARVAASVNEH